MGLAVEIQTRHQAEPPGATFREAEEHADRLIRQPTVWARRLSFS